MANSIGFPPIANQDARILILGSMPGRKSLEEQQYYAHPRNSFWSIMNRLFNIDKGIIYEQRKKLLMENYIALWDVLKSCYREGSLDSNIDHATIETNDFNLLFQTHKNIEHVFFNGVKAEQLFKKAVLINIKKVRSLKYHTLPSTSPAHASMTFEQKLEKWKIMKDLI